MRILLVGASGTIGRAVHAELGGRHEVIPAGRSSGDVRLDMTDLQSIRAAYEAAGPLDAVVLCTSGSVTFAPFSEMDAAAYEFGLRDKLMGQVNLVLEGRNRLADGGSFTLTTGVLDHDPIVAGTSASMVNGAVNAFVVAAAIEMPRGLRINVVSPRGHHGVARRLCALLPRLRARPGRASGACLREERGGRPHRPGTPGAARWSAPHRLRSVVGLRAPRSSPRRC